MMMMDAVAADDDDYYLQTVVQHWDQCGELLSKQCMLTYLIRMKQLYDDVILALMMPLTL